MSVEEYEEEHNEEKTEKNKKVNEEKNKKNKETGEEKNEDKFTATEGAPSISTKEKWRIVWESTIFFFNTFSWEAWERELGGEIKNSHTLFLLIVTTCDIVTSPNSVFIPYSYKVRFSCCESVSHSIVMITKGIEKLIKITPKIISFVILCPSFIYISYFVFKNDLLLI